MADLLNKRSSATLSKKISNGNGFSSTTAYDDVFGGPTTFAVSSFSSRIDDYGEIFGNFYAPKSSSSIPVLDFPVVEGKDVDFNVQSSGFNYTEVFGGLDAGDFSVSYEDMFAERRASENPSGRTSSESVSSQPAATITSADTSEECNGGHFDGSEKNQPLPNGTSPHIFDGMKQFNMSYSRTNLMGKEDVISGTIHIAQLDEVTGFTFAGDSCSLSQKSYDQSPCQVTDDLNLNEDSDGKMMESKHFRETTSDAPVCGNVTEPSGNNLRADRKQLDNKCAVSREAPSGDSNHLNNSCYHMSTVAYPNEAFVTVSEISLRTQPSQVPPPSRPPPKLAIKEVGSNRAMFTKTKSCPDGSRLSKPLSTKQTYHVGSFSKTYALGEYAKDGSPRFFDVEVDASSAAAASAAAMKEAMEKAQARLKSAKESMERKRANNQSRMKLGMNYDKKGKEKTDSTSAQGSHKIETLVTQNGCEKELSEEVKYFSGVEGLKGMRGAHEIPNSEEKRGHIELSKEFVETWQGKGSRATLESHKQEERAEDLKVEKQPYDLVKNEKFKLVEVPEQENNEKKLKAVQKVYSFEQNEKKVAKEACKIQNNNNPTAILEAHEQEMLDQNLRAAKNKQRENEKKLKAAQEVREKEENEKRLKAAKEASEKEENEKRLKSAQEAHQKEENEKRLKAAQEARQKEENEKRLKAAQEARQKEDNEKRLKAALEAHEKEENEKRLKAAQEARQKEENEKRLKAAKEAREKEENEKRLKAAQEAHQKEENEKRLKAALEAHEKEENEKRLKAAQEARERDENEKRLKAAQEAREKEENEKRLQAVQEAYEKEENEKRLQAVQEAREKEENEKRLKATQEAREKEENEKRLEAAQEAHKCEEQNLKADKEACDREEEGKKLKAAQEEHEELAKKLKSGKEAREQEEKEMKLRAAQEAHDCEENEKKVKGACEHEEAEKRSRESHEDKEHDNKTKAAEEACQREENGRKLKVGQDGHDCEDDKNSEAVKAALQIDDIEKELKVVKGAHGQDKTDMGLDFERKKNKELKTNQDTNEHEERNKSMEAANKAIRHEVFEKKLNASKVVTQLGTIEIEPKAAQDLQDWGENDEKPIAAQQTLGHEVNGKKMKTAEEVLQDINGNRLRHEAYNSEANEKQQRVDRSASCEPEKDEKKPEVPKESPKLVQNETCIRETHVNLDREENNKMKLEAVKYANCLPVPTMSQDVVREGKKTYEIRETEEREEEEERVRKEKEMLSRIEEEREREREREKDRISVERATLEARDRASVEARERAERIAVERVTAEARQRALAEAWERAEKASAEAREKSIAERASIEAKIRAERAAVERATAEARERAAERAIAEARERAERSVTEKFAATSRDWRRKDSEMDGSVGFGAKDAKGMRQTHSFSDVRDSKCEPEFQGADGESAERYKARLERYHRTSERAAKALAEKNLRDICVQREQAERNRLSESLDAEVRRWSNGKEGNLRALLSTLQYILGPDSGWQPIPLTDVITAAAVKKAYRKATLCVHPDKLQQRGASIQQKHICEKVFDLLKDAWNKFNSEVR